MELLAPAGNKDSLMAAIKAGCDAIYLGIDHFNMRARGAHNFNLKELPQVVKICHDNKVQCYVTVNTLIYEHEMMPIEHLMKSIKQAGVDAVIVADYAAIEIASRHGLEVHISTQMSVSNYETVKFMSKFANRVVLARELMLTQIKSICDRITQENLMGPQGRLMEIEVFGHGAMCVAISGRCGMSLHEFNASANRGACLQSCRRKYKVTDVETGNELILDNEYIMSPEDLCTIDFLDQVKNSGAVVLKIEGRARAAEYVDVVIKTYRKALNALKEGTYTQALGLELKKELSTVYNRGLSPGYFFGKPIDAWSKSYGSKATEEKVFVGKVTNYFTSNGVAQIFLEGDKVSVGDAIAFIGPTTGVARQKVNSMQYEHANVKDAPKGTSIAILTTEKVRKNDKVYVFKQKSSC